MIKSNLRILYTLTIFLSAYLLFLVQPMIGKVLLPSLGGTPSVWNTAMVFFQLLLLLGYLYAHIIGKIKTVQTQLIIHGVLMGLAFMTLPMALSFPPPNDIENPLIWQMVTMGGLIGLPFFILSTSAPLIQKWFSMSDHSNAKNPYFLYAASNVGSLLALILYPVLVERFFPLAEQALGFQIGFAILISCILLCGLSIRKATQKNIDVIEHSPAPNYKTILTWLFLAFVPSSLMLGFTSFVTTDIGSTPLFWVVPLTLYILSFILAFSERKIFSIKFIHISFIVLFLLVNIFLNMLLTNYKWEVAIIHGLLFFVIALMCHQKLDALKPSAQHLTLFFLILSIGGACGGIFNALIAPHIFLKPYEYMLMSALALFCWGIGQKQKYLIFIGLFLMAIHPVIPWETAEKKLVHISRNYFGTLTVRDSNLVRTLAHGTTDHGSQAINPKYKLTPITYYYKNTAVAQSLLAAKNSFQKMNAAVLGLGAGVLSCHLRPNDHLTFIEIDPDIIKVAKDRNLFSYIDDCKTPVTIIQGDARLKIQTLPDRSFDYILVDVFSGDNIPIHLLTVEAVSTYLKKIKDDGVLTFHVSNRYMKLAKEVGLIAKSLNIPAYHKVSTGGMIENSNIPYFATEVVMLTNNRSIGQKLLGSGWTRIDMTSSDTRPWTDTFANPLRALFSQ